MRSMRADWTPWASWPQTYLLGRSPYQPHKTKQPPQKSPRYKHPQQTATTNLTIPSPAGLAVPMSWLRQLSASRTGSSVTLDCRPYKIKQQPKKAPMQAPITNRDHKPHLLQPAGLAVPMSWLRQLSASRIGSSVTLGWTFGGGFGIIYSYYLFGGVSYG